MKVSVYRPLQIDGGGNGRRTVTTRSRTGRVDTERTGSGRVVRLAT